MIYTRECVGVTQEHTHCTSGVILIYGLTRLCKLASFLYRRAPCLCVCSRYQELLPVSTFPLTGHVATQSETTLSHLLSAKCGHMTE